MNVASLLDRFPLPPRPRRPVRLGIIGCGAIAAGAHIPAIRVLRKAGWPVEVTAVCDLDRSRAAALANTTGGAAVFTDAAAATGSGLFEGVAILTPPEVCPALCALAIQAGQCVLVEKPVAADAASIRQLDAMAQRAGVQVQVAYNRRHQPLLEPFLREVENCGARHVVARFWRSARSEPRFYSDTVIHMIDLLNYSFGPVLATDVRTWPPLAPGAIPSGARVDFRTAAGPTIELDVRPAAGFCVEAIDVVGTNRTVHLAYQHKPQDFDAFELCTFAAGQRNVLFRHGCAQCSDAAMILLQGFVNQMARFCRLICGDDERPSCTLADAAAARDLSSSIGL